MEKWREIYSEDQLKKLQRIELMCLKDILVACEKLKLKCILYGGTLLGAIKYKGFIPWDDDVDLAMPREDYETFLKEAQELLGDKYVIQNVFNTPQCPYAYTKVRLKGTVYIEEFHHKLNIEEGIYIDLYPIDRVPDNTDDRIRQFKRTQFYLKLFFLKQCLHVSGNLAKEGVILTMKSYISYYLLKMVPLRFILRKIYIEMTKYNNCDCKKSSCLFYPNSDNYYDKLEPYRTAVFEDVTVNIPGDTEEHLTRRYGDISKEPAPENRIGHYPYKISFGKY